MDSVYSKESAWLVVLHIHKLKFIKKIYIFRVCLDTAYFTENWKHYSKIIFKCMNSTVWPIFNKNFVEKETYRSREQYTGSTGKAIKNKK